MNAYGINGNLLSWFGNYFKNRKQQVINRSAVSSFSFISAGVPQGSVLGPLLFLIYINDIGEKLHSLSRLFADDTALGYSSRNVDEINTVINHDLNELNVWSRSWLMSFNPDKTEIMVFSNIDTENDFNFSFEGKNILLTDTHKHLGVTFSSNAKWNDHVENIIKKIYKHLCMLRKLKLRMNRVNLEKLYLIFIRPLFEYACEVWDNCGSWYSNKLERQQLEAARIITGLPIFTKTVFLYQELGWETLAIRRQKRKLQLFYNMRNGTVPNYLCDLVPPTIQSTTVYPLRNGSDLIVPFCRLSLTTDSFIPSTIKSWNKLDTSIQSLDTITKFKNALRLNSDYPKQLPKHFSYGPRKLNIILTQIRCSASFLNYDLFKINIVASPNCNCGFPREDAEHFFFFCKRYSLLRNDLLHSLIWVPFNIDLNLITKGSANLTLDENIRVFRNVYKFIKESKRFLIV